MTWRYVLLAVVTTAIGLVVHLRGSILSPVVRDVAGDALWAVMMVWIVSAIWPKFNLAARAGVALAVCFLVETSQRWHTPWLDSVRGTVAGHLVLGSGFDPRDFVAYSIGVLVAVAVAHVVFE